MSANIRSSSRSSNELRLEVRIGGQNGIFNLKFSIFNQITIYEFRA